MSKLAICAPFGSFQVHHQLDVILATCLRVRGMEAFGILCDGIYPTCDVLAWAGDKAKEHCFSCSLSSASLFSTFQIPVLQMRSFLDQGDFREAEIWVDSLDPEKYATATFQEQPIGSWVTSSVCSYFRITSRDFHQPRVRKAHRQFLINGVVTHRALQRIFHQEQPSHCSIFNARMAPYRVAFEVAREKGLPVLVHERGWADNTFLTFENRIAIETTPVHEYAQNWSNVPLTVTEFNRTKNYFSDRELGKDMNLPPFITYATNYAKVFANLRIPVGSPFLIVCTSSEYELEFCKDYQSPLSQLDFIRELIEIFRHRPEYLIIRHHPSIGGEAVGTPDYNFLSRSYELSRSLPENVRFVSSTEQLSSYALFWHATACISPFSTTGMEAVARGVPTAGFEGSAFREGLTTSVLDYSRNGIEDLVQSLFSSFHITTMDLQRLYRSLYSFIGRLCVEFKLFGIKDHYSPDIRINSADDFQVGHDLELDRLCRFFTHGESLQKLPAHSDFQVSNSLEMDLLKNELKETQEKRDIARSQAHEFHLRFEEKRVSILSLSLSSTDSAWEDSLRNGRHQNYQVSYATNDSYDEILRWINTCDSPYCIIRPQNVRAYDEAFLSRGIDFLEENNQGNIEAIFFGLMALDASNRFTQVFFSQHKPLDSEVDLLKLFKNTSSWQMPFSSMVLSTSFARRLFTHLMPLSEEERHMVVRTLIMDPLTFKAKDALVFIQDYQDRH